LGESKRIAETTGGGGRKRKKGNRGRRGQEKILESPPETTKG